MSQPLADRPHLTRSAGLTALKPIVRSLHPTKAKLLLAALLATFGFLVAAGLARPAVADTSITVTAGGCSGGGTTFCFTPEAASGTTGAQVTWTNQSGLGHTVTLCDAGNCSGFPGNTGSDTFNLSLGATNGSTASFTFSHPGTYYYYCMIHGYVAMHGGITVTASAPPPQVPEGAAIGLVLLAGLTGGAGVLWRRSRRRVHAG